MKKLFICVIVCLFTTIQVHAQDVQEISGYCGKNGENIKWVVNTVAGTLVFEGSGEMASYNYVGEQPWMGYKNSINSISVGEGITSITNNAFANMSFSSITLPTSIESLGTSVFQNCKQMKQITLPDNIISIGGSAFSGSGIEALTIPNSVLAISSGLCLGCENLSELVLPEQLTEIGDYAFSNCSSLYSIVLPESLVSIGNSAFEKTGLKSVVIPSSITALGTRTFYSCPQLSTLHFPNNLRTIGKYCFASCSSLDNVVIPDGLNSVGDFAFQNCTSLKEVILKSCPSIGYGAFQNCSSLVSVSIPDDYEEYKLGKNVFWGCSSLSPLHNNKLFIYMPTEGVESYTLPDGIITIAKYAFYGNTSLKQLYLPSTINSIGEYAFASSHLEELDFSEVEFVTLGEGAFNFSQIKSLKASDKIYFIGGHCFEGCNGLTEIDLSGLQEVSGWVLTDLCVPNGAFKDCQNLKTVKMPISTKFYDIKQEAFSGCTSLEEFDFSNIGIIDRYAFSGCSSLKRVSFENNSSCPYLNDRSFSGCANLEQIVFSSKGCQQFFMSAFEGCSKLTSIEWLSEIVPKIFDLRQSPYYGLWDKGFDFYNLPYGHVTFKMFGYIADERIQGSDQEFWKKVQFDKIYETLSGECGDQGDNVTWSLDTKEGVLRIAGSGNMKMPEDENVLIWKDRNRAVKQVELSADIESICPNAFSDCPIKNITLNKHLKSIGDNAFSRSEIEAVTFNDELTSIGNWAFGNCTYLQNIEVGGSVKEMGYSVFSYCQNLQTVVLPSNLESFGQAIFNQCTNLKSVIFPKRISDIPQYAFGGCWNLTDLYIPACTPPSGIGSGLGGIVNNNLTLHIPQGTKSAYQTSSIWSTYNKLDEYYAYVNVYNNGGGEVVIGKDSLLAGNWDDYLTLGDSFGVKLIPNNYYEVSNFTINGTDASDSLVDNILSFDNLQESKNIQVAFAPKHFSVSVDVQGRGNVYVLGYDLEISGKFEVTHDNEVAISAFPNEGYKLTEVILNDSDITNQVVGGYAIFNPTQDMNIKVTFSKDTFKLTYMIAEEIYKETEYEFEAVITPEPVPEGDYKNFEWIGLPETMPAHDVVVTAAYETGIFEVLMSTQHKLRIYSPEGKLLDKPQKGLNIIIMDNGESKKVFIN